MKAGNHIIVTEAVVEHRTGSEVVRALDAISLTAGAGSSTAVMGPSGCGKSTLLGLLAGLAIPTEGTIRIGDVTISDLSERERVRFRRQSLGMVYQADNLLPHLTVEENVGLQQAISRRGERSKEADPARLLDRLGIGALAKRFPDQLSGGQRQRAAVARAVIHRPAVILADEPTGALDDENARAVLELLVEVQCEMGATLVMVTHAPEMAAYLDRTVELLSPSSQRQAVHAG